MKTRLVLLVERLLKALKRYQRTAPKCLNEKDRNSFPTNELLDVSIILVKIDSGPN